MRRLIIANWKMNPATPDEAKSLISLYKKLASKLAKSKIVILPPSIFLNLAKNSKNLQFGVQNISTYDGGSHTGEISIHMAKNSGAEFALIGHSERRKEGETNAVVSKKSLMTLKSELRAIVCIGESERDTDGRYLKALSFELIESLSQINSKLLKNLLIAYEPIWAIGGSVSLEPRMIEETVLYIKKILVEKFGREDGLGVPIIYGGSVTPQNVSNVFNAGVDGILVGHESLKAEHFKKIVEESEIK